MNKDKIKIILGIVLMISIMIISGVFLFKNMFMPTDTSETVVKTEESTTEIDESVNKSLNENEELPITKEELTNMSQDDKNKLAMGEGYVESQTSLKVGDEKLPECPKEETENLYNLLIKYAESADYKKIIEKIDKEKETYKFYENYNLKIGDLYLDATLMIATLDAPLEQKGYIASNIKDPYMRLIGTLMLPEKSRRTIITNSGSLSPVFSGNVTILNTEILTNESDDVIVKNIYSNDGSINSVYKFKFMIEQNKLIGYIVRYENGTCSFNQIVLDGNYYCPYQTINYWMSLDYIMYPKGGN